jgi:FlaA1/EpsC-like NDP-sugar epimerase
MEISGKRMLVIGGAGLIGSNIAKNEAVPFSAFPIPGF